MLTITFESDIIISTKQKAVTPTKNEPPPIKKKGKPIITQSAKRYKIMTVVKIENGKIYCESYLCERKDVFEIVEKIPTGFFVWNIGDNMGHDEYIPLCKDLHKENFEIDVTTLKAIKLPINEVKALREAAHVGIVSKKTAERALKSKRRGYWSDRKRAEAEKTIDIFKRITA